MFLLVSARNEQFYVRRATYSISHGIQCSEDNQKEIQRQRTVKLKKEQCMLCRLYVTVLLLLGLLLLGIK
jgi:hypothetical protein